MEPDTPLPKGTYSFVGTCVGADPDQVNEFADNAEDATHEEFVAAVGKEKALELEASNGVPLATDPAVAFKKGLYQNRPTIMMDHSRIFHFYCLTNPAKS
jgi:hypothetical protein